MNKIDQLNKQIHITRSHARHCTVGRLANSQLDKMEIIQTDKLCDDKKAKKFELEPQMIPHGFNMKPEQKLIAQAARNNNHEYIHSMSNILLAKQFDFKDHLGRTPLYIAVVNKNLEAMRELVKLGADVNVKCENGNTCLHRMMLSKDGDLKTEQIINILLNNGQVTRKQLIFHQHYHEQTGEDY